MRFPISNIFQAVALLFAALVLLSASPTVKRDARFLGVQPQVATDYIYAVVAAGRRFYANQIVERLQKNIGLKASENWVKEDALPLPSQFLKLSAESTNARSTGFKIRLISKKPLNPANAPLTVFENHGLQGLAAKPEEPFAWVVKTGGGWSYQAIYPDVAVSKSCVACHNAHPRSSRRDYRLGDVLGGLVIQIPLRRVHIGDNERFVITPQSVSSHIHTIVESDRMVYSKHIVNRLRDKEVVGASENWREENALPLPAQFLARARELTRRYRPGLDFRLISHWPINYRNGAANEFERNALDAVRDRPHRPYYGQKSLGGSQYFQGVFPDYAVSAACVHCHNAHPKSPKTDFKLNDLMGALVVSFTFQ